MTRDQRQLEQSRSSQAGAYPVENRARDEWILAQRPARKVVNPYQPHGFLLEEERSEAGAVVSTATIFLTNRECPWRCLMCDLWKTTLPDSVPEGAIPAQIDFAFRRLRIDALPPGSSPAQVKLYNGGSFFDPRAILVADHDAIAERVCSFDRVVVECHPSFVRDACLGFRDLLVRKASALGKKPATLEVAMGLETAHPGVLEKLNKRMTLDQFSRASEFLRRNGIALRVFVLVKPPFLDEAEGLHWAEKSIDFSLEQAATVVSLIPTRGGNGALEVLLAQGQFAPPKLRTLEAAHAYGIRWQRARVFADLWDLAIFSDCPQCFPQRRDRLRRMNFEQVLLPEVSCESCASPRVTSIPANPLAP